MAEKPAGEIMRLMAQRAVVHARDRHGVALDFSEASVERVEDILAEYSKRVPKGMLGRIFTRNRLRPLEIESLCNQYGAYIGEVFRKHLGGEWRYETEISPGENLFALDIKVLQVFPPSKVAKRLYYGEGDDVNFYYMSMKAVISSKK